MYAIVDIETSGSQPQGNGITEIAIILHNGQEIEGKFETLINPNITIPPYIVSLTGINNAMLKDAPTFTEVAPQLYNLLKGRIFVAHNVNFDYAFLKYQFKSVGIEWNSRKLCTIRLARKAFPGYKRYGLEHICNALDIPNYSRHRAAGDALATATLFQKILDKGGEKLIKSFLKKENGIQNLPSNLPLDSVKQLPYQSGVYYFHNAKGKVIYVGKAKNIQYRVASHFSGLDPSKRRQLFLQQIHSISYKITPTEFMASILESAEIKRLWPVYNVSQKKVDQLYALYCFEDQKGFLRLGIDKKKKILNPIAHFTYLTDAYRVLWKMVKQHNLHPALCFLDKSDKQFMPDFEKDAYNQKVKAAILQIQQEKKTFLICEADSCILVEDGKFYGMGELKENTNILDVNAIKLQLEQLPENDFIQSLIASYANKHPDKVLMLSE